MHTEYTKATLQKLKNYEDNSILTEALFQKDLVSVFRDLGWFCCHINNNQHNVRAGRFAKEQGVLKGTPDILIGVFGEFSLLELKIKRGRLSEAQDVLIKDLQKKGFPVMVLYGVDDAIEYINQRISNPTNQ